jgi:hypothetical protein
VACWMGGCGGSAGEEAAAGCFGFGGVGAATKAGWGFCMGMSSVFGWWHTGAGIAAARQPGVPLVVPPNHDTREE